MDMDKAETHNQQKLLKEQETRFKEKLETLRAFIREASEKSTEHTTGLDNVHPHVQKAEHDAQFYEERIKDIHAQLHPKDKEPGG